MNICVLTHTFPRNKEDSAAAFMNKFADGLVQAGAKVTVVAPYDPAFNRHGDPFKIVTYKYIWPVSLHVLGYSRTMEKDISLKIRAFLLLPFLLFFGTLALLKTVKKEKIDLINIHWLLPNGLMTFLVSKLTKVPFLVTLPGTDTYLAFRYKLFGRISRMIANKSIGLVAPNRLYLKRVFDLGVDKNIPSLIIHYPVDVNEFHPSSFGVPELRQAYHLKKDNLIILAVGRLVYKKGFRYLVGAMRQISKKFPEARLIIGGEGDLILSLKNLVRKMQLNEKIIFAGNINHNEINSYFNLADVMVAPSVIDQKGNFDGEPMVSFESMACGKPQVVTNILGVSDLIKDGLHGFVVPQKDERALALAIEKLLGFRNLRKKMGDACRLLVTNEVSPRRAGERYLGFISKALKEKNHEE